MKTLLTAILWTAGLFAPLFVRAQGFVNLDFESADLSGFSPGSVPTTNAIPGWTAFFSGGPLLTNIFYDTSALVEIVGSNTIQGNYYINLQQDRGTAGSIAQTGTIPTTAQWLIFWGNIENGAVSFDGQTLPLTVAGQTASYNIYETDISSFSGQTGQLLFSSGSTPYGTDVTIDNIQFSSSSVPEPGEFALATLSAALYGFRRWRKSLS